MTFEPDSCTITRVLFSLSVGSGILHWRDFYRKWNIVGASLLVLLGLHGAFLSFGVFLKPILGEFLSTRAFVSGAASAALGFSIIGSPFVGKLTDRYGARILIVIAALLVGAGYILTSQLTSIWQIYFYFGIMGGTGMAFCWTTINTAISRRFVEKRILALGIATSGISIGAMVMPLLSAYWIMSYGWRSAYIFLAIIVLLVIIPAMALPGRTTKQTVGIRDSKQGGIDNTTSELQEPAMLSELSVVEATKTVPFWMLMVTGVTLATCFFIVIVHIVPYATDLGVSPDLAAIILSVLGGATIIGRLVVSFLVGKIGSRFAFFFLSFLQAFALFLFMQANGLWVFYMAALFYGFGSGGVSPIRTSMVPEFFGMRSLGTLIGFNNVAWCVGGAIGPILAGYIFDLNQSYDMAFLVSILLMIITMAASLFLRAPRI